AHARATPAPATAPRRRTLADPPAARVTHSTIRAHVPMAGALPVDRDEPPVEVAGVAITHPSRVVDPSSGLTKLALARYVATAAPRLLEQLAGRPMMVARCQHGLAGPCYWQKHVRGGLPAAVHRVVVRERAGLAPYLAVDDVAGLVTLAQLGAMEFHVWGARADAIERPDRVVFDLDPDEGVPWARVVEGAQTLRERLAALELDSFVKTTGGKGLHVEVPIARRHGWDEVKDFSRTIAQSLVRDDPSRYVATLARERGRGRILVDWLRNGRGATWVVAWSPRRRARLPVAMPLRWSELETTRDAAAWTIANAGARVARDPWRGMRALRQRLPKLR
ncbi:MAG TPA: non-homologous end-joining DNA ligase, partial [Candidatus Eisenbacteria bacterium]|nr:non-homologous end-joining DNA ligase [Candidatus Eisenbacteria bacterium]